MPAAWGVRLSGRRSCLASSDLIVVLGLCLSLYTQLPVGVSGHGYLIEPPSRSSAWRLGFANPVNYNDNELYCGGFDRQWKRNGGRCGVCGDPWDAPRPRPNEVGGKFANGIIVGQYSVGQVVVIRITITAQHQGWFEFRLCSGNESIEAPTTQECLDANLLEVKDSGQRTRYQLPPKAPRGIFNVTVKLPEGLACSHCVLQWKWHVGNSWGVGSDGVGCLGCGPQEEFINCADISISHSNSSATTTAIPSPKSSTRFTPRSSTAPSRIPRPSTTQSRIASASSKRPITTQPRIASASSKRPSTTLSRIASASSAPSKTSRGKLSSTVTSLPAVSINRSSAGCRAIGLFEGNVEMDKWCVTICALNLCPGTHCKCDQGSSQADFTFCKSIGIWKSDAMDKWCVSNCAAGFCPSDYCKC